MGWNARLSEIQEVFQGYEIPKDRELFAQNFQNSQTSCLTSGIKRPTSGKTFFLKGELIRQSS
jgi:hypothetical protein